MNVLEANDYLKHTKLVWKLFTVQRSALRRQRKLEQQFETFLSGFLFILSQSHQARSQFSKKDRNFLVPAKKTTLAQKDAELTSQLADHRISYDKETA